MGDIRKIRVLLVDDSAVVRSLLTRELSKDPDLEIIGAAIDPYQARDKIVLLEPDVVVLDVEMPRMDGITFLGKLMEHHPMPVIILSSLTPTGCETALRAFELGALEVMHKPALDVAYKLNEMIIVLSDKIKAAFQAKYKFSQLRKTVEVPPKVLNMSSMIKTTDIIVAIGASTGGTEALKKVIQVLPPTFPGTLIVQHMPENFTKSFADHLNSVSAMEVREAQDGDTIQPGLALIAKGNNHMILRRSGARYYVQLKQGPLVCRQRPSVEVLFDSVATYAGRNAVGAILTGMGNDGAYGLLHMKEAGAYTMAQDEESCVVFGMPQEAIKLNAVDKVLPLDMIPQALVNKVSAM